MSNGQYKNDKKPCKINLHPEQIELIKYISEKEDKFKEQVFEDAMLQLLIPRMGEVGLCSIDFTFYAPLSKNSETKEVMYWLKSKIWTAIKGIQQTNHIHIHAITYTAVVNYLKQWKKIEERGRCHG